MLKHNKKRNVGLATEFLSRHIASCILENYEANVEAPKQLWVKYFVGSSELAKEHEMFNALYKTNVKNREVAVSLLEKVKTHCNKMDAKKLEEEKTEFIHEVKSNLHDQNFFNRDVEDFRTCATIQILMNLWRENDSSQLVEVTELEDKVLDHLIKEDKFPEKDPSFMNYKDEDVDGLVVKIMTEKFNAKYDEMLTENQKDIVNLYVFAEEKPSSKTKLVSTLAEVRRNTLTWIEYETHNSTDTITNKKLTRIRELLEGDYKDINHLSDDMITFYMTVSKLQEELADETA